MKVLVVFLTILLIGQAGAIGIGLLFDRVSNAAGIAAFIAAYYSMFWIAWRATVFLLDREPDEASAGSTGRSRLTSMGLLLAPATLAAELCD